MSMKIILFISIFASINLQYYNNQIRFLVCGAGVGSDLNPDLVDYPKEIPVENKNSSIRIFIDYTKFELDSTQFEKISSSKKIIKEKLSKAAKLMEQIIMLPRYTENIAITNVLKKNISSSVPVYDSTLTKGVSYDLIVFPEIVSAQNTRLDGELKHVTFNSYPLVLDPKLRRPMMGKIEIFDLDYSKMDNQETYFLNAFIHQLMHILVFDPRLIKNFPNYSKDEIYTTRYDYSAYNKKHYIITPKVLKFARRHFNNKNLKGLPMDYSISIPFDDDLHHWDARFMVGDIMIGDFYEEQAISEMTLALFEDSNWYKVNYYTGGLFRYGKNETYLFTDLLCVNDYGLGYHEKNMFCQEEGQRRCTAGRLNKGYCKFFINEMIPEYFQYYKPNATKGGRGNVDFCPITQKEDETRSQVFNFYPGNCRNGLLFRNGLAEQFTDHSFCAISSVIPLEQKYEIYANRRAVCYPMHCTETTLTIQIGDFYMTCPRSGGVLSMPEISGYFGVFECPDYNLICTGTVVCNNIEECIEKKSLYKEGTFIYDGYTHSPQSLDNLNYYTVKSKGEESNDGKCGKHCLYCNEENSCLKCSNDSYIMASRSSNAQNKTKLFCDKPEKFSSDKYVKINDIYYPIENDGNENRNILLNQINSQEDEDITVDKSNKKDNDDILEGEILNNSNNISINFLKLSFIAILLVML